MGFLLVFLIFYFFEINLDLKPTSINEIGNYVNKHIKIDGEIISIRKTNSTTFVKIINNGTELNGVIFDVVNIEKRDYVFEGKISIYNGELELIIDKFY